MFGKGQEQLKPLSTLPNDGVLYRIDALGTIRQNPHNNSNPLIDIIVSPLSGNAASNTNIMHPSHIIPEQQRRYQISAGEIFVYTPGCVFLNGKIQFRPSKPTFSEHLCTTPDRLRFISADHKTDHSGKQTFLIPPYIYKMGSALRSTLLAIEQHGDPYAILIPTIEIFRSCYCSSSDLNKLIFSSDVINFDRLTAKGFKLDRAKQKLELCLRKRFPDEDAIIIGNILTNEQASLDVKKVWAFLVSQPYQNANPDLSKLKIGFPAPDIHLRGMSINLPTSPQGTKRILITTIISCRYPLAFSSIDLSRENSGSYGQERPKANRESNDDEMDRSKKYFFAEMENSENGFNDPFSSPSGFIKKQFLEASSNRFPSIIINKIYPNEPQNHQYRFCKVETSQNIVNQSTSDLKFSDSNSAPISIVPKEKLNSENGDYEWKISDFSSFNEICKKLEKSPHILSIQPIVINGIRIDNSGISQFPSMCDGKILKWAMIDEADSPYRPRQLAIKKILTKRKSVFHLMEIERKQSAQTSDSYAIYIFSNNNATDIPEETIKSVLLNLSINHFKNYNDIFRAYGLQVKSRKHTGSTDECANAIIRKIFSGHDIPLSTHYL